MIVIKNFTWKITGCSGRRFRFLFDVAISRGGKFFSASVISGSGSIPTGIASPNFQPAGKPGITIGTSAGIFTKFDPLPILSATAGIGTRPGARPGGCDGLAADNKFFKCSTSNFGVDGRMNKT